MIYFLRHVETGLIKIGTTKNLKSRVYDLEREHGKLEVMGFVAGYEWYETELHKRFDHLNKRGVLSGREWFSPDSELINYIEKYTSTNPPLPLGIRSPQFTRLRSPQQRTVATGHLGLGDGFKSVLVNRLPEIVKQYQLDYKEQYGKDITEEEIAKQAKIDKATFSRYKNSLIGSVNLDVWQRLVDFFQVDGCEIFSLKPNPRDE